jgi:hypothetical protein
LKDSLIKDHFSALCRRSIFMPEQTAIISDDLREIENREDKLRKQVQKELATFRERHKREQTLTEETLWIHLVHGTWANPEKSKVRPTWSEPGGSLEMSLRESALRKYAKSDLWEKVRFAKVPSWSGRNSFGARNQAVVDLQKYLHDVLYDPQKTFGRHLVIAHSHGGTVVAEALRNLGPLAREFSGFLTLGTPFVQRVRVFESPDEVSFDTLTGVFAPAVALFFSLSLAIDCAIDSLLWHAGLWLIYAGLWMVYAFIPAFLCQIQKASGFGWALCSITPAMALAFFWLALAGKDFGNFWGSCLVAGFVAFHLAPKLKGDVRFLNTKDKADSEEQLPRPIEVELVAIRAPGDEASLAISAASGAIFVSDTIRGIGTKLFTRFPGGWRTILAISIGVILVVVAARSWPPSWPAAQYVRLAGLIAFLGPFVTILSVLIIILALKFTAVTFMALACGPEAFEAPGLMRVYAEPLPRSSYPLKCPMTLRMTFPTAADLQMMKKSSGLRHSIYEYPSVQEYLTTWIHSFISHSPAEKGESHGSVTETA